MTEHDTAIAIHEALKVASLEYCAYSSNGVNIFGDRESIKATADAFHIAAQRDEWVAQVRHWREECGKLHAKIASLTSANSQEATEKKS